MYKYSVQLLILISLTGLSAIGSGRALDVAAGLASKLNDVLYHLNTPRHMRVIIPPYLYSPNTASFSARPHPMHTPIILPPQTQSTVRGNSFSTSHLLTDQRAQELN